MNEWISVSNEPPPRMQELLFFIPKGTRYDKYTIFCGYWEQEEERKEVYVVESYDSNVNYEEITHWQPLPKPPNEKE